MDTFPIAGDDLPIKVRKGQVIGKDDAGDIVATADEHYDGWFLLLDEFNSAPTAVQAAA